MTRPAVTRDRVVDAAAAIADGDGYDAVSLAAVASALGVRSPSLYHHVDGLEGLRRALRLRALERLGDALRRAAVGRAGSAALSAVAHAQRRFAAEHPGLYATLLRSTEGEDEELRRSGRELVEVIVAVVRGYGHEGDDAVHAVRALRAAVHGFVSLEAAGGFGLPLATDASFERLVALLDRGLSRG